ncbi:MAG: hypothetical protein QF898_15580, partial [SAR202 cluster bacterium]|nr:hypothetical protein [SAR202 cluster bacterium]
MIDTDVNGSANNLPFFNQTISGDGRYVAFDSQIDGLVADDSPSTSDVFVYDLVNEEMSSPTASNVARGNSHFPSLSDDGQYVAFYSHVSDLVDDDTNNKGDIFVYDRVSDTIAGVRIDGNNQSRLQGSQAISSDGRYVTYVSYATKIVSPVIVTDGATLFTVIIAEVPPEPRPSLADRVTVRLSLEVTVGVSSRYLCVSEKNCGPLNGPKFSETPSSQS